MYKRIPRLSSCLIKHRKLLCNVTSSMKHINISRKQRNLLILYNILVNFIYISCSSICIPSYMSIDFIPIDMNKNDCV